MQAPVEKQSRGRGSAGRGWLLAAVVGGGLLGFIIYATTTLREQISEAQLTGVIVEKSFTPQPETQITIGKQGVRKREIEGIYQFRVRVPEQERYYDVWVNEAIYNAHKVGDRYRFPPPMPTPPPDEP